jgi:uncharacterized protein YkwD
VVLENVARAHSPEEAERGLMDSPGHRANLLSPEVDRIGIGIERSDGLGGTPELLVTQLFLRGAPPFDAAHAPDELARRVAEVRRAARAAPLARDAALDRLAQATARDLAAGTLEPAHAGERVQGALAKEGASYRALRSVFAVASGLDQLDGSSSPALLDGAARRVGLGVARGRRSDGGHALFIVVLLGTP